MATTKEYVIRIVQFERDFSRPQGQQECSTMWLENLRYAGIINYHIRGEQTPDPTEAGSFLYKSLFDLYAPSHIGKAQSKVWAEQNAARMRSFGINAQAAPKWERASTPPDAS